MSVLQNKRRSASKKPSSHGHRALDVLQRVWGYPAFREHQAEVVASVLQRRDTVALLPTGGGKSICFQVPGIVLGGVTIVVSPLISLMQDQVAALASRGVGAFALVGHVEGAVLSHVLTKAKTSACFFIYVAPERLEGQQMARILKECTISQVAIDEAHCISSWGHDFRPSYRRIASIRQKLPHVPFTAVTATATPRTVRDMHSSLQLKEPTLVQGSFNRSNLFFAIWSHIDARKRVLSLLNTIEGAAVIYESSREGVEVWTEKLVRAGISAVGYHAGMEDGTRLRAQTVWMRKKVRVIVATNAFGMGIDRPDVRLVIHVGLPGSMEAYYQEAGRARRAGRPAQAHLIVTPDAIQARQSLLGGKGAKRRFGFMKRFTERRMCRRWAILGYFGEKAPESCGNCDVCKSPEVRGRY